MAGRGRTSEVTKDSTSQVAQEPAGQPEPTPGIYESAKAKEPPPITDPHKGKGMLEVFDEVFKA